MSFDVERKVWCGPSDPYLYGSLGIGEAIFEFMSDNPDHMIEVRSLVDFKLQNKVVKTITVDRR